MSVPARRNRGAHFSIAGISDAPRDRKSTRLNSRGFRHGLGHRLHAYLIVVEGEHGAHQLHRVAGTGGFFQQLGYILLVFLELGRQARNAPSHRLAHRLAVARWCGRLDLIRDRPIQRAAKLRAVFSARLRQFEVDVAQSLDAVNRSAAHCHVHRIRSVHDSSRRSINAIPICKCHRYVVRKLAVVPVGNRKRNRRTGTGTLFTSTYKGVVAAIVDENDRRYHSAGAPATATSTNSMNTYENADPDHIAA